MITLFAMAIGMFVAAAILADVIVTYQGDPDESEEVDKFADAHPRAPRMNFEGFKEAYYLNPKK